MIRKVSLFFLLVVCGVIFSGCNTVRGAYNGAKQDWEAAKQWDKNFRKNYW